MNKFLTAAICILGMVSPALADVPTTCTTVAQIDALIGVGDNNSIFKDMGQFDITLSGKVYHVEVYKLLQKTDMYELIKLNDDATCIDETVDPIAIDENGIRKLGIVLVSVAQ